MAVEYVLTGQSAERCMVYRLTAPDLEPDQTEFPFAIRPQTVRLIYTSRNGSPWLCTAWRSPACGSARTARSTRPDSRTTSSATRQRALPALHAHVAARVRRAASWRRHRRTPPVRLPEPCLTHDYTERVVAFDITGAPDVPPQYLCADPAAVPPMRPTRVRATYRSRPGAPWAREIVNVRGLYVPAAPYTHQAPAPLPAGQRP